jgi:hypothetical protein
MAPMRFAGGEYEAAMTSPQPGGEATVATGLLRFVNVATIRTVIAVVLVALAGYATYVAIT